MLANNICYCCQIEEINTPQQVSNFECGVHVIVNTKHILDHSQTIANYNLFSNFLQDDTNNVLNVTIKKRY